MKHMSIDSLIWYLSWPAFIALSYFVIRWVLRTVERRHPPQEDGN